MGQPVQHHEPESYREPTLTSLEDFVLIEHPVRRVNDLDICQPILESTPEVGQYAPAQAGSTSRQRDSVGPPDRPCVGEVRFSANFLVIDESMGKGRTDFSLR